MKLCMVNVALQRVDCGGAMKFQDGGWRCDRCSCSYEKEGQVIKAWPTKLGDLAKEEAEYHDHAEEDAKDVHQLLAPRNLFYHGLVWKHLQRLAPRSKILEIGAGSGFDAQELVHDYELVVSDISPETLQRTAERVGNHLVYVAADGTRLPFPDRSFDGVYMVATFHHFHEPQLAAEEMYRVLRPGGYAAIGIEPNKFYFYFVRLFRKPLCYLTRMRADEGSKADAEMVGFSYGELSRLFPGEKWQAVQIRPMWILNGLAHYGLELLYRLFRLKKRLRFPVWFERAIVAVDEWLLKIPGMKHFCWHWMIFLQKS